jgi:hypothetical protein
MTLHKLRASAHRNDGKSRNTDCHVASQWGVCGAKRQKSGLPRRFAPRNDGKRGKRVELRLSQPAMTGKAGAEIATPASGLAMTVGGCASQALNDDIIGKAA